MNGVWSGTPIYTAGVVGDAFSFDGTNRVTVADNALFDFLPTDAFTLDFNFKIDDYTLAQRLILNQGTYSSADGWGILVNLGHTITILYGGSNFATPALAITAGVFYRLKITYNNGTWNVYFVDMITPVKTQTGALFSTIRSGNLSFGAASNGAYPLIGAIDDIKLWKGLL
jgi:hypothetical protein